MTSDRSSAIGVKTAAVIGLTALAVVIAALRGSLDLAALRHLSPAACFLIGLISALAVALIGIGWRFGVPSDLAVAIDQSRRGSRGRLRLATAATRLRVRELPGGLQRALLVAAFACVALGALGNRAAARIVQLPDELAAPSPSQYCLPEPAAPAAEAAPATPPAPVEQPGCALVLRAYRLGYTKSLGACAPRQAAPVAPVPVAHRELCTRRQLDEPYLHYSFRRVASAAGAAVAVDPIAAADHRASDVRTHLTFLDGLLADIRHAITGSPHAAHHLWVTLPDPHPPSLGERVTGSERCSQRFADLPLWPTWRPGDAGRLVEHVLGQLLFAARFGTTASCSDYTIHWGAAPDICRQLAADPVAVLARDGALGSVHAVLDRRRRQLELGALAAALGRSVPPPPPSAQAIVSLACFVVDRASPGGDRSGTPATGATVAIEGDRVSLREIRVAAVRTGDDGPIDVYAALAALLAGPGGDLAAAIREPEPVATAGDDFLLARLDPLIDADPFRGVRAPLRNPELVDVYPFQHHLHGFVEDFRRRYLAQRGRL